MLAMGAAIGDGDGDGDGGDGPKKLGPGMNRILPNGYRVSERVITNDDDDDDEMSTRKKKEKSSFAYFGSDRPVGFPSVSLVALCSQVCNRNTARR